MTLDAEILEKLRELTREEQEKILRQLEERLKSTKT